ncbi:uncharacterized protein LOC143020256 [Oratosquilla oratoria]|uniref:uncharacterized protein LOC143020256 n=1 Tax=Oratosquilla oratoria TaxID=337810 RepID=UPI003F761B07
MKTPRGPPLRPPLLLLLLFNLVALPGRACAEDTKQLEEKELVRQTLEIVQDIQESIQTLVNATVAAQAVRETVQLKLLDWVMPMETLKLTREVAREEGDALCPDDVLPSDTCSKLDKVLTNITIVTDRITEGQVTEEHLADLVELSEELNDLILKVEDEDLAKDLNLDVLKIVEQKVSESHRTLDKILSDIETEEHTNTLIVVVSVIGAVLAIATVTGIVYGLVKNKKPKVEQLRILGEEVPVSTFANQDYSLRSKECVYDSKRKEHDYSNVYDTHDDAVRIYSQHR